jgi:hypothetical protein
MQVLRSCWNDQIPACDFPAKLAVSDSSELLTVASSLIDLCSSDSDPTPFFLDYLTSLCVSLPDPCMSIFTDPSPSSSRGLLRLLSRSGDTLFNSMDAGSEFSARCALSALELCLDPPLDSSHAIVLLCKSHAFSVLIASARLWFYDEILQIRVSFDEAFPQSDLPLSIPFPRTLLRRAVLIDDLTQHILFTRHEILSAVVSNLPMWSFVSKTFSMANRVTFYHLYLHVVSDFLEGPTLVGAFLVTNLLVRIVNSIGQENVSQGLKNSDLVILFDSLRQCSEQVTPFDEKEEYNCDFLSHMNLDELQKFFTAKPPRFDDNALADTVFRFPLMASELAEHILVQMENSPSAVAARFADQVIERCSDFSALIIKQGIFLEFITRAFDIACEAKSADNFFSLWMLPLTLLWFAWGSGPEIIRGLIPEFVYSYRQGELASFLCNLLEISDEPPKGNPRIVAPYGECLAFGERLLDSTSFPDSLIRLGARPYLWPSALLWSLKLPVKNVRKLIHESMPPSHLLN